MFIDSHCHLTHEAFAGDLEEVIKRALAASVRKIYCTGGMIGHDEKVIELCKTHSALRPVIGISPHDAWRATQEQKNRVYELIEKNNVAAIGEIGLDFHHFKEEEHRKKQEAVFREQIELARSLDLPVVIHSRKAEEKILDIIQEEKFRKFAMHCFIVKSLSSRVVQQGGLISLPTIKSKDRKYIMTKIDAANLLCETDSPYLWSERNEPANVVEVYQGIAKAKQTNVDKIAEQIEKNTENFFRW